VGIRDATAADAAACAAIYAPFVTGTAITFETDPPDTAEFARRIAAARRDHAWLVAEQAGRVLGYAYAGPWKARPAYRWTAEVAVYIAPDGQRSGLGRALYEALFARLADRGYRTLIAGVTLPNEASLGLHRALGFASVGTFASVGWKLGAWRDVHYLSRTIGDGTEPPAEPR
jgi:phosphinothricin acetyltransferase